MKIVFIGGSRKITRLAKEVQAYIDKIVKHNNKIIIGDANGIDKAIQIYLKNLGYQNVEVFCMKNNCRNNIGGWQLREVYAPKNKKSFAYYTLKDEEMAKEASIGFMVWNEKSIGTLANIYRLIQQKKRVDVYLLSKKCITTLTNEDDWYKFFIKYTDNKKINNLTEELAKVKFKQRNLYEI